MTVWSRRAFGVHLALGATLGPRLARAGTKPQLVVIGGGIGGATLARTLAAGGAVAVTLVEPKTHYTTGPFSNLYLAGMRSLESLTHGYETLAGRYGVTMVHDSAEAIDAEARRVRLANGASLSYDRLVVAPGIAFRYGEIDGYDAAAAEFMPHAWDAETQTRQLRSQLEAMEDGGVFVIAVPPAPFRGPPAPYERASLAAYYFRQFKPRSKIVILDGTDGFAQQAVFQDGWDRHYPGMIAWLPVGSTGGVVAVDAKAGRIRTAHETFTAAVANLIPRQIAGAIAQRSGLADASGWCPVDPVTFESTRLPGIHVIGDAADAGAMPKTAFCANVQAKACAGGILTALTGAGPSPPHLLDAAYTFLAGNDAMGDAASFTCRSGTIRLDEAFPTTVGEPAETRRKRVREAFGWYDAFTRDVFG